MGAVFVLALSITGAVLWWPGDRAAGGAALTIRTKSNWKLFNWQLHNVIGLWMLPVVFMFGAVGVYARLSRAVSGFREQDRAAGSVPAHTGSFARSGHSRDSGEHSGCRAPRFRPKYSTGDKIIRWFSYLHFGNFGGWPSKAVWVVIGLAPAFLFVTGVLMWWNRVLGPAARRVYNCRSWQHE